MKITILTILTIYTNITQCAMPNVLWAMQHVDKDQINKLPGVRITQNDAFSLIINWHKLTLTVKYVSVMRYFSNQFVWPLQIISVIAVQYNFSLLLASQASQPAKRTMPARKASLPTLKTQRRGLLNGIALRRNVGDQLRACRVPQPISLSAYMPHTGWRWWACNIMRER